MRMIFVNLPVKNIETSRAFFTTLGFTFNPEYSDDRTLCMIVEENIFVMLLQEERFRDFINGDIADAKRSTEVLTCLSAGSREEIDRMIEAARQAAAAGNPFRITDSCMQAVFRIPTATSGNLCTWRRRVDGSHLAKMGLRDYTIILI